MGGSRAARPPRPRSVPRSATRSSRRASLSGHRDAGRARRPDVTQRGTGRRVQRGRQLGRGHRATRVQRHGRRHRPISTHSAQCAHRFGPHQPRQSRSHFHGSATNRRIIRTGQGRLPFAPVRYEPVRKVFGGRPVGSIFRCRIGDRGGHVEPTPRPSARPPHMNGRAPVRGRAAMATARPGPGRRGHGHLRGHGHGVAMSLAGTGHFGCSAPWSPDGAASPGGAAADAHRRNVIEFGAAGGRPRQLVSGDESAHRVASTNNLNKTLS